MQTYCFNQVIVAVIKRYDKNSIEEKKVILSHGFGSLDPQIANSIALGLR